MAPKFVFELAAYYLTARRANSNHPADLPLALNGQRALGSELGIKKLREKFSTWRSWLRRVMGLCPLDVGKLSYYVRESTFAGIVAMDKVRDIFSYFVAALTMFAFLGAVYQAFQNEKGSAFTLGTLFLIGALIVFLPQVEFIKTLGVEAKLRQTVNEATTILERLKRLSAISAKSTYMSMAWGNRMGSPSAKEKQAVLDEVDRQLIDLKVSPEERAEIVRPFVRIIGFDLYMVFARTIQSYGGEKNAKLREVMNANHSEEHREAFQSHSDRISKWSKRTSGENPFMRLNTYDLKTELDREMPSADEWLNERERGIAQRFEQQILDLFAGCEKKGGFTPEAADFHEKYSDNFERNARELFQQALEDIK